MDEPRVVGGRFRIVGTVEWSKLDGDFEGADVETGDRVRLLRIPTLRPASEADVEAFVADLRRGEALGPPVRGAGRDGEGLFVAWAWPELPTVFDVFRQIATQLPAALASDVFVPLGRALAAAHREGRFHGRLVAERLLFDAVGGRTLAFDAGLQPSVERGLVAPAPWSPLWSSKLEMPAALRDACGFSRIAGFMTRIARIEGDLPEADARAWDRRFGSWRSAWYGLDEVPTGDPLDAFADFERLMDDRLGRTPPPPPPEPEPEPQAEPEPEPEGPSPPPWEQLLAALLDAGISVEVRADGELVTGDVTWRQMYEQRRTEAVAARVVRVAKLVARAERIGEAWRVKAWLAQILLRHGYPRVRAWPEDQEIASRQIFQHEWWLSTRKFPEGTRFFGDERSARRVSIHEGVLAMSYAHDAWIGAHDRGVTTTPYASIPCALLPADPDVVRRLVDELELVSPGCDPRPVFTCRLCQGEFDGMDFNVGRGVCHSCAERHLGVRY